MSQLVQLEGKHTWQNAHCAVQWFVLKGWGKQLLWDVLDNMRNLFRPEGVLRKLLIYILLWNLLMQSNGMFCLLSWWSFEHLSHNLCNVMNCAKSQHCVALSYHHPLPLLTALLTAHNTYQPPSPQLTTLLLCVHFGRLWSTHVDDNDGELVDGDDWRKVRNFKEGSFAESPY